MGLFDSMKNVLEQYASGTPVAGNVESHFAQVAQTADPATLAHGIAAALQSGQAPPFAQVASQWFANATPDQKAGMLNALLSAAPPALRSELASAIPNAAAGPVTGTQASAVSSDAIAALAGRVHDASSGAIDTMSAFYAQHPTLVKTLGGAALVIAMRKIAERQAAG